MIILSDIFVACHVFLTYYNCVYTSYIKFKNKSAINSQNPDINIIFNEKISNWHFIQILFNKQFLIESCELKGYYF